ncbi:hypothetical protein AAY473_022122 [Plecturocebus cupreus]
MPADAGSGAQAHPTPAPGRPSHDLQAALLPVQLHLELVQLLDLAVVTLRFVAHQGAVEVDGEDHEDEAHGHHDDGGHQGGLPACVAAGAERGTGLAPGVHGEELNPAEQHHLGQEEQDAEHGGEAPGQLDVGVHALVRGLADGVQVVDVTHGLHVGQDAGADEEREQVHGHQHRGAGAEGNQQRPRVLVLCLQLHLHHGHLRGQRTRGTGCKEGRHFERPKLVDHLRPEIRDQPGQHVETQYLLKIQK